MKLHLHLLLHFIQQLWHRNFGWFIYCTAELCDHFLFSAVMIWTISAYVRICKFSILKSYNFRSKLITRFLFCIGCDKNQTVNNNGTTYKMGGNCTRRPYPDNFQSLFLTLFSPVTFILSEMDIYYIFVIIIFFFSVVDCNGERVYICQISIQPFILYNLRWYT